ncbi:isopeptide-forming domain-containing fimbrial protein [Bifidobacterium sp. ESL0763]|uniref:isopeptide-forming domain-containing fimbrial protein n=1 Tax=Bifidobacterium sp. ESL0763 TaxID=2983227 RepID=UPI0023F9AF70|nr:isopeptide-forming domain-containing fimbrial protein [Bifidobacterium sp. ESL0763]MDF7664451.1 isopeptide-forming domain-containing fimbrial protein [Bifidobacterium sp. ESL0763]
MLFEKTISRIAGVAVTAATLLALAPLGVANAAGDTDNTATRITMPTKSRETIAIHGETNAMTGHTFAAVKIGDYAYASVSSVSSDKLGEIGVETNADVKSLAQTALDGVTKAQDAKYKGNPVGEVAASYLGYKSVSITADDKDEVSSSHAAADAWGRDGNLRKFVTNLAKAGSGDTSFASKMAAAKATKPEDVKGDTGDSTKSTVTMTGLAPGLYVVEDVTNGVSDPKAAANSIPMLVGTGITTNDGTAYTKMASMDAPLGSIEMKSYNPTIEKKVLTKDDDVEIGGDISYQLTSQVPLTTGFDHFVYTMVDKPGPGLTFKGIDKVTIGDKPVSAQTDTTPGYVVKTGASSDANHQGDTDFIDIDFSSIIANHDYNWQDKIVVVYHMSVNDNADEALGLTNNVSLAYSNDVRDQTKNAAATAGDGGAVTSGADNGSVASVAPADGGKGAKIHFRHFNLLNVDKLNGNALAGDTFTIKSVPQAPAGQAADSNIRFRKLADGSYKKAADQSDSKDNPATSSLAVSGKGKLLISGLSAGTYEIAQATPTPGYSSTFMPTFQVKLSALTNDQLCQANSAVTCDVQFKTELSKPDFWGLVSKDATTPFTDGIHTGSTLNWKPADGTVENADNSNAVVVRNVTSISQLPLTGGAGAIMALLVTVVLMVATALLIVARRKVRE